MQRRRVASYGCLVIRSLEPQLTQAYVIYRCPARQPANASLQGGLLQCRGVACNGYLVVGPFEPQLTRVYRCPLGNLTMQLSRMD